MSSNWVKVFESVQGHQAYIVQEVLEEHDIKSVVMDKQDSAYKLGGFEVYVDPDHVMRALYIIKEKITFG